MAEAWRFYLLVFAAVFLAAQAVPGLLANRAEQRRMSGRFSSIGNADRNRAETELLKKRTATTRPPEALAGLYRLLQQSGTGWTAVHLGAVFATLFLLIFWPAHKLGAGIGALLSATTAGIMIIGFLRRKRSQRISKFGEQLPDVIDIIIRSLRAGHPLPVSLSLVGREMPSPAGPEFLVVFDEISYGRDIRHALENLLERVGHPDLSFLITSISIAHQTGGNLGEILSRLSKLIRERFRLKRKIRALSSEGRFGGIVLSAIPILLFAFIALVRPEYYGENWGHPVQNTMLCVSIVLLTIGNIMIYKLVNFKV